MENTISERLKRLRKEVGLTQEVAARKIGISYSTLQAHEGGNTPSKTSLKKYVAFYDRDEAWLLTGRGEPSLGAGAEYPNAGDGIQPSYIDGGPGTARDKEGLWGKTEHIKQDGLPMAVTTHEPSGPSHTMAPIKAVESLTTILQSGNSTIIRAILSNLEAFGAAVEQETRDKARIAALEEKCSDLRSRMTDLEEKMSLILEVQKQKKTASTNV